MFNKIKFITTQLLLIGGIVVLATIGTILLFKNNTTTIIFSVVFVGVIAIMVIKSIKDSLEVIKGASSIYKSLNA